jgi:hypothetical protein
MASVAVAFLVPSTGNSQVTMGGTTFTVTVGSPGSQPGITPTDAGQSLSLAVSNPLTHSQKLTSIVATMATDGSGNVLDASSSDAPVPGCLASWFTLAIQDTNNLPATIAAGATDTEASSISITESDPNVNQDACIGTSPELIVSAS